VATVGLWSCGPHADLFSDVSLHRHTASFAFLSSIVVPNALGSKQSMLSIFLEP
jgi:hypothetical protein